MKNLVTLVLLALCATLISACDPTTGNKNMSPDDYLTHNISIWNGVVSQTEPWIGGERGQKMLADASGLKSMKWYKNALDNPRKELGSYGQGYEGFGIPEDAQDLDFKLKAYQKSVDAMLATMQEIAALPDGYTEVQLAPLLERLQTQSDIHDTDAEALDAAQKAYAKKHNIQLVVSG